MWFVAAVTRAMAARRSSQTRSAVGGPIAIQAVASNRSTAVRAKRNVDASVVDARHFGDAQQ
jgi:hypothetical protein